MAWHRIGPMRGVRASAAAVTLSARRDGSARLKLNVTISGEIARDLGWVKKQRIKVEIEDELNIVRLSLATGDETFALHGVATGATVAMRFPLPWDLRGEPRKPERCSHRIEAGALLFDLPAWALRDYRPDAAPPPKAATPAAVRPASGSLVLRDDREREARELLRARIGMDDVVRQTGLSPRDVVRINNALQAERAGRAA